MSHFILYTDKWHKPKEIDWKEQSIDCFNLGVTKNEFSKYDKYENEFYLICWQGEIWYKENVFHYCTPNEILNLFSKNTDIHDYLSGNFALLIIDKKNKTTYTFTDKYGTVPIFYLSERAIFLSTEYEVLLATLTQKKINYDALAEYFLYDSTLGEKTLISNIKKLPSNACMIIDAHGNFQIKVSKVVYSVAQDISIEDASNKILEILQTALKRTFLNYNKEDLLLTLSGGLDSRILLGLIEPNNYEQLDVLTIHSKNLSPENDSDVLIAKQIQKQYNFRHRIEAIEVFDKSLSLSYFENNQNFTYNGKKLMVGTYGGEFLTGALDFTLNKNLKERISDYQKWYNKFPNFFVVNKEKELLREIFEPTIISDMNNFPSAVLKPILNSHNGLLKLSIQVLSSSFFSNVYRGSLGAWLQPYKAQNGKLTFYLNPELVDYILSLPSSFINDMTFEIYHHIYKNQLNQLTKFPTNNVVYTNRNDALIKLIKEGEEPKNFRSEISSLIEKNFGNTNILLEKKLVKESYLNKIKSENNVKEIAKVIDLSNWLIYFNV